MSVYIITVGCFLVITLLTALVLMRLMPGSAVSVATESVGLPQFPQVASPNNPSPIKRFDAWFERLIYFSGIGANPVQVMLLSVVVALSIAGVAFLVVDHFLISAALAVVVWCVSMGVVLLMGQRRLKAFEDQLPDAMNLLSKAVRAGESFEQGVQLVGESTPDPLGIEFRRCGGQLEMGLPVGKAMRSLSERVGSFDMQVFASTVAIHRQAGGNLSETLDRLAAVIRERMNYRRQMKSITGAGRISAMVISCMAPIIFLYLFFFQPQYGRGLWDDPLGKVMVVVAFVSQLVGVLWVKYILKSEY